MGKHAYSEDCEPRDAEAELATMRRTIDYLKERAEVLNSTATKGGFAEAMALLMRARDLEDLVSRLQGLRGQDAE